MTWLSFPVTCWKVAALRTAISVMGALEQIQRGSLMCLWSHSLYAPETSSVPWDMGIPPAVGIGSRVRQHVWSECRLINGQVLLFFVYASPYTSVLKPSGGTGGGECLPAGSGGGRPHRTKVGGEGGQVVGKAAQGGAPEPA